MTENNQSPRYGRYVVLAVGGLFLLGLIAVMAFNLGQAESAALAGNPAPDFTLPLFDQFEQDEVSLAELRGQVVVINFWASWCVECYREADLLEQAYRDYKARGVVFLGVDYLDTEKDALAYLEKYDITYPNGPDIGDKIADAYAISGVPETFFIDRTGQIAHVQLGPITERDLYALLDSLVAETPES